MDRRSFLGFAMAGAVSAPAVETANGTGGVLRIAHIGDPQFGFGPREPSGEFRKRYGLHMRRFENLISSVNALKPDVAVISGDMTHYEEDLTLDWPRLIGEFSVPVLVTPGNHDTSIPLKGESVEHFRKVFGYDYRARDAKGWRIIAGNTQYWYGTGEKKMAAEYEEWLRRELAQARAYGGRVIVAGHVAPFAYTPEEADSYENCPLAKRKGRLEAYLAAGARFYLSGHMHRMCARNYGTLAILTAETTSVNFDKSPYAFRLLEIASDFSYTWRGIPVM
jgi:3',5'-cyclic AMP phosphodiesterase CpdA